MIKKISLILTLLSLTGLTLAEEITVFVTDAKGNNIAHNINLMLVYDGEIVTTDTLEAEGMDLTLNVNHSGQFFVWAYFTDEVLRDGIKCTEQGWDERSYACLTARSSHVEFEYGCYLPGCQDECENGSVDGEGNEILYHQSGLLYYTCRETQPGYYNKVFTITSTGYGHTHVKPSEEDEIRITLATKYLWEKTNN